MRNLKVLSLGRNQIKRIMGLDDIAKTLEELWLSYNLIDKLDGLSNLKVLVTFYIGNNRIKQWEEVDKLAQLPELRNVMLYGNPIYGDKTQANYKESNALLVVKRAPQVENVDGHMLSVESRDKAQER